MESSAMEKSEEINRQIDSSNTKSNSKQQNTEKANERPEWLPDGWNMEVRTRKSGVHMGSVYKVCYIDPLKGYKFFSKPEVLRYLETAKDNNCTSKKGKKSSNIHSPTDNGCTSKKETKRSDIHFPDKNGCTSKKEKKSSNMHPPNDSSCTSKKEKKCSNMDSPNDNSCTSKGKKSSKMHPLTDNSCTSKNEKKCSNMDSPNDNSCTSKGKKSSKMDSPTDVVVEKSIVEDLPPGWVKELKIRKNGNGIRKDPFYIDPVSGYVFRSKKDVLRYLESGDIHSCAFKPSKRQIQDEDNLTPPTDDAKKQKLKHCAPKQQISAATKVLDKSFLELLDANSSRKGKTANVPSGRMVTSVGMAESVVKMHSLEDENSSEMKKTSDPGSSALLKDKSLKESEKALSTDDVQGKEHVVNMTENDNQKNRSNHSISKNRKEFNVGHRSSPRFSGSKPVQLTNNVINEQTLQVPKRNMRKSRNPPDVSISEEQAVSKEQPHQQGTDRVVDNKPEIRISSNKSSNKKDYHLPRRASKRLAGIEHNATNSISCEEAPKYRSKRSKDEVKVELQQNEGVTHAPITGKSANKRKKSEPQLEKSENEEMDDEKSEPPLSFAFHYSWSDPSLESAINTLTGVLPPVDTKPTTVSETDDQKTLVGDDMGRSATTVPETDNPKTLVGNSATTVPETDNPKTLVGNSATTVPETDNPKSLVGNSATTVPETDNPKTLVGNSSTTVPETDNPKTLVGNSSTTDPETDNPKTLVGNVTGRSVSIVPETDIEKTLVDHVTGRSNATVPEIDIQKNLVDNVTGRSTATVLETDIQKNLVDTVTGRSTATVPETDINKTLVDNVIEISTSIVPETDIQKTSVDNVTGRSIATAPETDIQEALIDNVAGRSRDSENNLLDTVTGSRQKNSQVRSNKPKRKKDVKVPMRLSKRLAGLEPEVLPVERALEYSTRKSCKEEPTVDATSTNGVPAALTNGVSDHHDAKEETKVALPASDSLKTEVLRESSNQSEKSHDASTGHEEQIQKVEAENIGDRRSEQQLPLPFGGSWSDPCLEFAFKTLTGALPVDSGADNMPLFPPGFDNPPYKRSHGSVVTSVNQEACDISNQSPNGKELNMVSQLSGSVVTRVNQEVSDISNQSPNNKELNMVSQLSGNVVTRVNQEASDISNQSLNSIELNMVSQPELRIGSTSYENAPKFTTRESCVDRGNIIRNLDVEPHHSGNITQPVHHSRNINTVAHEEPSTQNGQVVEGGMVSTDQQLFQPGIVNHDNSELHYCAPFMNSWSDPCLEFAFKTLTGVIPVEENLTLQGCFQEPANYHDRRDSGAMLPDFGTSGFSQSDFSFLHDTGVKPIPGQQSSMSSSFLPVEKTSLQGFAGVDPQAHFSQCNNNFQRR
ncbi:hypothetical protein Fmac_004066 [Flemingia macrophylla]|uniref:MBD domain-containing protein n=1 Tax=Flemingia macrophylla TaxID=520843 RepID=A0ABD1N4G0_9FABA